MAKPDAAIGFLIGGKPKEEGDEHESDDSEAEDMAKERKVAGAKRLISAVKSGDPEAVAQAFHDMYEACSELYSEDGGESEE